MATSEPVISVFNGVRTRTTFFQGGGTSTSTDASNRVLLKRLDRVSQTRGKVPGYNIWKGTGFGLSKRRDDGLYGAFNYSRESPWSKYSDQGRLAGYYGQVLAYAPGNWTQAKKDAMQAKCELDMLNAFLSGPNLAQMAAERKQIESLATSFLNTTISVIKDVKRRDFKRAYRRLTGETRDVANLQLLMQYGVKPLASDVYSAITRITEGSGLPLITSKGSARESWSYREDSVSIPGLVNKTVFHKRDSGWRSTIVAECTDPALAIATSAGLTNPLSIAYELMPYSFVLDWIAPVGPAISAATATNGFKFLSGSRTYRAEHSVQETQYGTGLMSGAAHGSSYHKDITRSAYNGFPFVLPVVNFEYTPTRFFNTLAMGWQKWTS